MAAERATCLNVRVKVGCIAAGEPLGAGFLAIVVFRDLGDIRNSTGCAAAVPERADASYAKSLILVAGKPKILAPIRRVR
jgi:hypothetical protein